MQSVYLETTIFGYLASRPSRDALVREHQRVTSVWWEKRRGDFELFISPLIEDEIGAGDATAAAQRQEFTKGIPRLEETDMVKTIGRELLRAQIIPARVEPDALHIAFAAVHEMDYLLTWNCKHLANAEIFSRVGEVLRRFGAAVPTICTPLALMSNLEV